MPTGKSAVAIIYTRSGHSHLRSEIFGPATLRPGSRPNPRIPRYAGSAKIHILKNYNSRCVRLFCSLVFWSASIYIRGPLGCPRPDLKGESSNVIIYNVLELIVNNRYCGVAPKILKPLPKSMIFDSNLVEILRFWVGIHRSWYGIAAGVPRIRAN